jgi:hypothetical protein
MLMRNLAPTAVWAVGTFILAMAAGFPSPSGAVDPPVTVGVPVSKPKLSINGLELSVDVAGAAAGSVTSVPAPDQPLLLHVHVVNPTSQTATAQFTLRLLASRVASPAARTLPMPREIWQSQGTVAVAGKDTDALSFTTAPLPAEGNVVIEIAAGGQSIVAWRGTVQRPMMLAQPAAAATQPSQSDAE